MTLLLQGAGQQVIAVSGGDPIGDTLRADAVAYWRFNEASGTRIDATGRGNALAETNGSTAGESGLIGNAAHFTGIEARCLKAARSNDLVINPALDFYAAVWVKFLSKTSPQYILFSEDTIGYNIEYYLSYETARQTADRIHFAWVNELSATTFGSPPINEWLFVEIFYRVSDAYTGIAINNGIFDTVFNTAQTLYNNDTTLFFGDLDYGEYPLDGYIDECYYSHTIPDQAGRDYLYNSGAGRALFP